jgi:eukaryotic-like serine/threonine-protein kinase
MNPNQLQAKTVFEEASGLADAVERRAYLDGACGGDAALRQEVESLMRAYERSGSFLQPSFRGL